MSIGLKMRLDSLVFIRFIAAIIVINFHYAKNIFGLQHFYTAGQQMVTFFFVLSGFVLAYGYGKKEIHFRKYIWSRLKRIAPLYFLGLFLVIAIFLAIPRRIDTTALLLNLFFVQSLIPGYALSFNYPAWFLSTQMALYFLFPLIFPFLSRLKIVHTAIFGVVLWIAVQIILIAFYNSDYAVEHEIIVRDLVFYNPLSHLPSFVFGIVAGLFFQANLETTNNKWIFVVTVFCVILGLEFYPLLNNFITLSIPFGASFFAPVFVWLILVFVMYGNFSFFANKTLLLLGEASFAIYILHAPIHIIMKHFFGLDLYDLSDFIFYLVTAVLVGVFVHLVIEKKPWKQIIH